MAFDITTNPLKPSTIHDPQAILDYSWDFTDLLVAGDPIIDAHFVCFLRSPDGAVTTGATATLGAIAGDGKSVWAWFEVIDQTLLGATIAVTCHYKTADQREDDRTLYFKIRNR